MKRTLKITSLGVFLLLGFYLAIPRAHADDIYASVGVILRFDSSGNQSVFANSGLDFPDSLAFDNSGNLYVANAGNNTIEEFGSSGTGSVFATATSGLDFPTDLAFDSSGNLFVANAANNTIVEFNSSATGSVFATASSGLDMPEGLAFDSSGNLYVANYNDTILKFNTNGVASTFATAGVSNPQGLAFDSSGQGSVFATHLTNGNPSVSGPEGLAFDSSGDLYVANHNGGDVLEINPEGEMSVFASGFGDPAGIAIEVPEPSSLLLSALGAVSLIPFLRRKRA
jgi:secreted PhoX family phosphatase